MANKERQQIIGFIGNLAKNNNREWFQKHRNEYDTMRRNLEVLVNELGAALQKIDLDFKYTKFQDYTFRIYRDVRFSKDKSPYKNHIGIYLINGGRKSPMAGYYVHIEAGNNFIAGGLYHPEKQILRAIRNEFYFNYQAFDKIVNNSSFRRTFGELWQEDKLKRNPKDFPPGSPADEWLKYKSFIVAKAFSDEDFVDDNFIETTLQTFRKLKVFNDFLNEAILLDEEEQYEG